MSPRGRKDTDPRNADLAKHIKRAGLPPDPKPIATLAARVRRMLLRKRGNR